MAREKKKAGKRCNAHQPKPAPTKEQASRNLAKPDANVNPDMRSVLNAWREDARNRAIQIEYATWAALSRGAR